MAMWTKWSPPALRWTRTLCTARKEWISGRSCTCGSLGTKDSGSQAKIAGWVQSMRPSGQVVFIGLRDSFGVTQIMVNADSDLGRKALKLKPEDVIAVEGIVQNRPDETVNREMKTGRIEVVANGLEILNTAEEEALGIPVERFLNTDAEREKKGKSRIAAVATQEAKLRSRYLDIRGVTLQRNLRVRAANVLAARKKLSEDFGFVEVETPLLFKSTPEGAREFLVPTRHLPPGTCYALTQSPQQYKQILMAGGIDRYFQFAKCFRDEGGRADRQPEFTQLDMELSFASVEDIQMVTNEVVSTMWRSAYSAAYTCAQASSVPSSVSSEREWVEDNIPEAIRIGYAFFSQFKDQPVAIPTFTYNHVMEKYGSDKPDLRFCMEISDAPQKVLFPSDERNSPTIRAIVVRNSKKWSWAPSRKVAEAFCDEFSSPSADVAIVKTSSEKGSWEKIFFGSKACSGSKSLLVDLLESTKNEILHSLHVGHGDYVILSVSRTVVGVPWRQRRDGVCASLGKARLSLGNSLPQEDRRGLHFLWVVDFPLFEPAKSDEDSGVNAGSCLQSVHHPFTCPHPDDISIVEAYDDSQGITDDILRVRGQHYDLVCNGMELGGGSVRVHSAKLQSQIFNQVLGIPKEKVEAYFGHLLKALRSGCPPHAGIALGVDRLLSIQCEASSIRDVIAFPKSSAGNELMTGSPSLVSNSALSEYHLKVLAATPADLAR